MGCGVWGVGCGVWGVGCGVWGVGCGVWGVGCGVLGCGVLGCGVWGVGCGEDEEGEMRAHRAPDACLLVCQCRCRACCWFVSAVGGLLLCQRC